METKTSSHCVYISFEGPSHLIKFVIVIVICLPTEHPGVHENSLKRDRALPDRIGSFGF